MAEEVRRAGGLPAADLLEGLVRIPSVTGDEEAAVAWLRRQAEADGFRTTVDAAGDLVLEAGRGERRLLFVGHIDTVPGHIPVRVEDGVLWGRGSVDAKGCLVAAYIAARERLRDPGISLRLVAAVGEEGDSRGTRQTIDAWTGPAPDWILVGEPSGADAFTLGYKGIVRGALSTRSEPVHGGHPGNTAAEALLDTWQELRTRYRFAEGFDRLSGRLDAVQAGNDGLSDAGTARFQMRLPPHVDPGTLVEDVRAVATAHSVSLDVDEAVPAAMGDARSPLAAAFRAAVRAGGAAPRLLRKTGTADLNLLAQAWPGVPIGAYGPGDSDLDHTPHERLDLAELERAVAVLGDVLGRLAERPLERSPSADPAR